MNAFASFAAQPAASVDRSGPPTVSEKQATETLLNWLNQRNYYQLPKNCLQANNLGYKNAGYTLEVVSRNCEGRKAGAPLGRWRVDAYTAELFVQNENGKFKPTAEVAPPKAAPTPAPTPTPPAQAKPTVKLPPLKELEDELCFNGHAISLAAAEAYLKKYGAALAPLLAKMLDASDSYVNDPMFTGAFPYNALWMLGRIGDETAAAAIGRYLKKDKEGLYTHAMTGLSLRKQYGPNCGALHTEASLYAEASIQAKVLKQLPVGQGFRILKARVANPKEEGPRGGPALFDAIELIPSGEKGYIERMGTGDAPYF